MHRTGEQWRPLAAVLAGGRSRRIGRNKAFLSVGNREILQRVLGAALDATGEALLVVRDVPPYREALARYGLPVSTAEDGEGGRVRLLRDAWDGAGPLGGLETAARAAPGRPLWLLACDMPFVGGRLGRTLLAMLSDRVRATWAEADEPPPRPRSVVPVTHGRSHPLCAAYEPSVAAVALGLLERGERRMGLLLERLDVTWVPPRLLQTDHTRGDPLLNVNDAETLRRARETAAVEGTRETPA